MSNPGIILSFLDGFLLGTEDVDESQETGAEKDPSGALWVEDLLTSILLFGKGTIVAPSSMTNALEPRLHRLIDEELISFDTADHSKSARLSAAKALEVGRRSFAELAINPHTSRLLSYDAMDHLRVKPSLTANSLGQAEFAISSIRRFLNPHKRLLGGILQQYLLRSLTAQAGILSEMYADHLHSPLGERSLSSSLNISPEECVRMAARDLFLEYSDESAEFLLEICGMRPLTIEEFDRARTGESMLYNYHDNDLEAIWDIEEKLVNPEDFNSFSAVVYELGIRPDPPLFLAAHCFWRTLFDVLNLIHHSHKFGGHIFLPTQFQPAPTERPSEETITSDTMGIYRLHLSMNPTFPRVRSIDELLRLREDRRLIPLRTVMSSWLDEVRAGNLNLAGRIASDMVLAQRSLESIDALRRIASFSALVALPIALAVPPMLLPVLLGAASWYHLKAPSRFDWIHFGA